jgi:hypothetical protein
LEKLLTLYLQLGCGIGAGLLLGKRLPQSLPLQLGHFLFWVGVPLSVAIFLRQADLAEAIWMAPLAGWFAAILGFGLAWFWIQVVWSNKWVNRVSEGSFLLAAMIGNTGYLGYPVCLAVVGSEYFAWALFYDLLGSTLSAYTLGVAIASYFGRETNTRYQILKAVMVNPTLWSFGLGLILKPLPLPEVIEHSLRTLAWTIIILALVLIGVRLSQITSWRHLDQAIALLSIKMIIAPLIVYLMLPQLGITGSRQATIVIQAAMPPAFSTLVITEAFNLDRQLTVTILALGTFALGLTLPIWLWLLGIT